MKNKKRIEEIEARRDAKSAAKIARAVSSGDYSTLTPAESKKVGAEAVRQFGELVPITSEGLERGKAYTPTGAELVALQARRLCDVSEDALWWDLAQAR